MAVESERNNKTGKKKESIEYCLQLGSSYCKNECPNRCYDRYQNLIRQLFETADQTEIKEKKAGPAEE